MAPEEAGPLREAEERASAAIVGVDVVDFLGLPDAVLKYAVRDAGNRWVFQELLAEGLEPWAGVRQVWAAGSPYARHGVDVTEAFALGVESLRAHEAYLTGLGPKAPDVDEFLEGMARPAGTRLGARYGVAYEVFHFDLM